MAEEKPKDSKHAKPEPKGNDDAKAGGIPPPAPDGQHATHG
ncbi:MAG TPA: hypothetical protein VLJ59_00545 [Mycobacteriales bacterium]|nr:hypothetical protein [Mycobacteriales bacterium]